MVLVDEADMLSLQVTDSKSRKLWNATWMSLLSVYILYRKQQPNDRMNFPVPVGESTCLVKGMIGFNEGQRLKRLIGRDKSGSAPENSTTQMTKTNACSLLSFNTDSDAKKTMNLYRL